MSFIRAIYQIDNDSVAIPILKIIGAFPKSERQQVGLSNPSLHRQKTISSGHDQRTFLAPIPCGFDSRVRR